LKHIDFENYVIHRSRLATVQAVTKNDRSPIKKINKGKTIKLQNDRVNEI